MNGREKIGIVGLGAMGLGIAQVYAQAGHVVIATDLSDVARATAVERFSKPLDQHVEAGKLTRTECDAILSRFKIVPDIAGMAEAALVIEAIVERLDAKRALLAALEGIIGPEAILATNTSSLSVEALAEGRARPGRVLGLHFFNPAPVMKLVELIGHDRTDPDALAFARRITEAAGKVVIACSDRPGFIVNRCARPFYGEALALLEEGRTASDIDAAMLAAGYRIGPFALIDLVGADINLAATESLHAAMGGHRRYHVFESLRQKVAAGELGRKSGRGFLFPDLPGAVPDDAEAISLRIEAMLANEAAALLDEGRLVEVDIDTATKLGLNFPRGPFASARRHGLYRVRETLAGLERTAPRHLVGRYALSRSLRDLS